jgi:hypothetical protein
MQHRLSSVGEARPVRREYETPRLVKAARLSAVTGVAPLISGIPVA